MTISARRTGSRRRSVTATCMLAALCGAVTALPQPAGAQLAGGALAGGGSITADRAPLDNPGPPDPARCIRRGIDNRHSIKADDNQVTAWLSVRRPVIAVILANGSANSSDIGTLAISVMLNGVPIGRSPESRGSDIVKAQTSVNVPLVPGRQYIISAKAAVSRTKRLDLLNLYVGVGEICL